jgi:hypothetical protein
MDIKMILEELEIYLNKRLLKEPHSVVCESFESGIIRYPTRAIENEMEDFINNKKKPSFSSLLFHYIDERKLSDSQIYKKAGIDRRHFSKIRSNKDYRPGKNTVIALCLALELTREEADALLESCGFSLSASEMFDLIIAFCLERKIYDIYTVNFMLDRYKLKTL